MKGVKVLYTYASSGIRISNTVDVTEAESSYKGIENWWVFHSANERLTGINRGIISRA